MDCKGKALPRKCKKVLKKLFNPLKSHFLRVSERSSNPFGFDSVGLQCCRLLPSIKLASSCYQEWRRVEEHWKNTGG
jgi:hypothetical protein